MIRRGTFALAAAVSISFFGLSVVPASPASASPVSLQVTPTAAFAVLGIRCSGPQQQDFATGFDAATGFPDGVAHVSTTCSGSGRDPHSTTYYAWIAASWDFTGVMASYSALASPPTVNPSLSVTDSHGNQLYNQSGQAFLTLAPGFLPAPRVFGVSPATAPQGTAITITGDGFTGTTGVHFGFKVATFMVNSDTSITAIAPAVRTGSVNVLVINPGGKSALTSTDRFTFNARPRVAGLSPNHGSVDGGTVVIIAGANFTGATYVSFGGLVATFKVINDTTIRAISPGASDPTAGNVIVGSKFGYSTLTNADLFTFM
jgi:IPT/TIG domain